MTEFIERHWRIVAFKHPDTERSVLYRQNCSDMGLLKAVEDAMKRGANLISIRGFEHEPTSGT